MKYITGHPWLGKAMEKEGGMLRKAYQFNPTEGDPETVEVAIGNRGGAGNKPLIVREGRYKIPKKVTISKDESKAILEAQQIMRDNASGAQLEGGVLYSVPVDTEATGFDNTVEYGPNGEEIKKFPPIPNINGKAFDESEVLKPYIDSYDKNYEFIVKKLGKERADKIGEAIPESVRLNLWDAYDAFLKKKGFVSDEAVDQFMASNEASAAVEAIIKDAEQRSGRDEILSVLSEVEGGGKESKGEAKKENEYSPDNPFAPKVAERKREVDAKKRGKEFTAIYTELESVNKQIDELEKNPESYQLPDFAATDTIPGMPGFAGARLSGKRKATDEELAKRWEELNKRKKQLEQKLKSQ
jgi:hypothetical protein